MSKRQVKTNPSSKNLSAMIEKWHAKSQQEQNETKKSKTNVKPKEADEPFLSYDEFIETMIQQTQLLMPQLRNVPKQALTAQFKSCYNPQQVVQLQKCMREQADPEKQIEQGLLIANPGLADNPQAMQEMKRQAAMLQAAQARMFNVVPGQYGQQQQLAPFPYQQQQAPQFPPPTTPQ